jgi:solute carrier family 15 (peptide/histidine transporter), member 3/4
LEPSLTFVDNEPSACLQGMLTLTASAWLPLAMEDDSPDNSGLRRATAYLGLYLVSLGTGGIKPCTAALGADQFDGGDAAERVTKASFFNWYYFCTNIGSLLSGTVLVWVQENIGWGVGFTVQTVFMLFGLAVFVAGRKVYRYKKLGGSPLTRVAQVVVAAVRNCHLVLPDDTSALYHDKLLPTEPNFRIESARQFRCPYIYLLFRISLQSCSLAACFNNENICCPDSLTRLP